MVLSLSEVCEKEVKTATVSAEPPKVMFVSPTIVAAMMNMARCQPAARRGRRALPSIDSGALALLLLVAFKCSVLDQGGDGFVG
jgi:hypothetical protein